MYGLYDDYKGYHYMAIGADNAISGPIIWKYVKDGDEVFNVCTGEALSAGKNIHNIFIACADDDGDDDGGGDGGDDSDDENDDDDDGADMIVVMMVVLIMIVVMVIMMMVEMMMITMTPR